MVYFITEGSNIRIKSGESDFKLVSNTSKCINWTIYSDRMDLSIDEMTFDAIIPTDIFFDGVASANAAAVVASLKSMFSELSGGGSSYLVYTALLSQTGTDAPVATVLENTTGASFTWTRSGDGNYYVTSSVPLWATEAELWGTISPVYSSALLLIYNSSNEIGIGSVLPITDGDLYYTPIEIRVYP